MTVEDQRSENDMSLEKFPVGMRVLAVDDDPICLKVLETLLRKCQYQVTTSNQAIMALKMLRENRNKFDLVISDVNMPDMDGFKLLEHVGLEMDLPVIMLSAHSDTKLVMKGITHGACDYLLKPVRIEELKNIWQHVVRRRKPESKDQKKSPGLDKAFCESEESGKGVASAGDLDQNAKLNRKRKDQNGDEEEEEVEDDTQENEDPATQKKPRVVWSPDLHKKFVDAVSYLGYGNAFPKKILDVMNVEGLTRENVASHLQKFRLYLKRVSTAETQQANAVLGFKGFRDLPPLTVSARLGNDALSPSVRHHGVIGRLNSPNGLTIRGITSTELIQQSNSPSLSNSFSAHGKFHSSLPASQNASLFQGIPSSWELNQLKGQQSKLSNPMGDTNSLIHNRTSFAVPVGFHDNKATFSSSNSVPNSSSSALLLQRSQQKNFSREALGNQSLVKAASSNSEPYDTGISGSSNFLDHNRRTETWQGAVQSTAFTSTALPMIEPSNHSQMRPNNLAIPSTASHIGNNALDFSSATSLSTPLADTRGDLLGIVQNSNFSARQAFVGDHNHNMNAYLSTINSLNQTLDQNNAACNKNFDASVIDQLNGCTASTFPSNEIEKSITERVLKPNEDYLLGQAKAQDALIPNNFGSLDEFMDAMMRRDQNDASLMNGDFGFDNFPLGSCI